MNEPLNEILTQQQIHLLAGQEVTSQRELAMTFWLQRDQLAQLLNISEAEASRIVEQAAKHVSQAELEELADLAGRIKNIPSGVDPPDPIGGDQ